MWKILVPVLAGASAVAATAPPGLTPTPAVDLSIGQIEKGCTINWGSDPECYTSRDIKIARDGGDEEDLRPLFDVACTWMSGAKDPHACRLGPVEIIMNLTQELPPSLNMSCSREGDAGPPSACHLGPVEIPTRVAQWLGMLDDKDKKPPRPSSTPPPFTEGNFGPLCFYQQANKPALDAELKKFPDSLADLRRKNGLVAEHLSYYEHYEADYMDFMTKSSYDIAGLIMYANNFDCFVESCGPTAECNVLNATQAKSDRKSLARMVDDLHQIMYPRQAQPTGDPPLFRNLKGRDCATITAQIKDGVYDGWHLQNDPSTVERINQVSQNNMNALDFYWTRRYQFLKYYSSHPLELASAKKFLENDDCYTKMMVCSLDPDALSRYSHQPGHRYSNAEYYVINWALRRDLDAIEIDWSKVKGSV